MQKRKLFQAVLAVVLPLSMELTYASPEPVKPLAFKPKPTRAFAMPCLSRLPDVLFGIPARTAQLDAQRGGTDTVSNNMSLDGSVRDNVATNVSSGSNAIDAGSFANMSGIPTVIQNTGANVLIQNATIINLQFK